MAPIPITSTNVAQAVVKLVAAAVGCMPPLSPDRGR